MNDFRKYIDIVDEENIANESVLDWVADYLGYKPKDPKLGKLLYKQIKLKSEIDKLSKELDNISFEIKNHPGMKTDPEFSSWYNSQGDSGQSVRSKSMGGAEPQPAGQPATDATGAPSQAKTATDF